MAKVYLVAGDEPLLVDEALEQLRAAAMRAGFTSRELHTADRSFKWVDLLAGADNLSLFATRKIVEIRLATPKPGDEGSETIAALCERDDPDTLVIVAVGEKLGQAARSHVGQGDRAARRRRRDLADRARRAAALDPAARREPAS